MTAITWTIGVSLLVIIMYVAVGILASKKKYQLSISCFCLGLIGLFVINWFLAPCAFPTGRPIMKSIVPGKITLDDSIYYANYLGDLTETNGKKLINYGLTAMIKEGKSKKEITLYQLEATPEQLEILAKRTAEAWTLCVNQPPTIKPPKEVKILE